MELVIIRKMNILLIRLFVMHIVPTDHLSLPLLVVFMVMLIVQIIQDVIQNVKFPPKEKLFVVTMETYMIQAPIIAKLLMQEM